MTARKEHVSQLFGSVQAEPPESLRDEARRLCATFLEAGQTTEWLHALIVEVCGIQ